MKIGETRVSRERADNRPYFVGKPCEGKCGTVFGKKDKILVVETATSWFRGDDEVTAYCEGCRDKIPTPRA